MSPWLSWEAVVPIVCVCLAASAFFSGVETGLMSVSRIRLHSLRRAGGEVRSPVLEALLDKIDDPILTTLIGTNLFNVFGSAVLAAALGARFGSRGEVAAVAVGSVLIITFGEILPKVLYREYPERLTLRSLPVLRAAMTLLAPVRVALMAWSRLLSRLTPLPPGEENDARLRRDALASLLSVHPRAAGDAGFAEVIARCLDLSNLNLTVIMTPWQQASVLPRGTSAVDCRAAASASGFSRLPVHDAADRTVVGWLLARDLVITDLDWTAGEGIPDSLLRTCPYVDQAVSPWALFEEMRWQRQQMAIVVDATGNMVGLVTLEDLLEILVGSIEDEFDRALQPTEPVLWTTRRNEL
jgi:CBS domain containing-hemolysin-like protein